MESKPEMTPEFERLLANDPLAHTFYMHWRNGDFPSFEAMMMSLAVVLADDRRRLIDAKVKRLQYESPDLTLPARLTGEPDAPNYVNAKLANE